MNHALHEVKSGDSNPAINAPAVSLKVHPLRSSLYDELHNRPSPVIDGNCQITHFSVMLGDKSEAMLEHVLDLCKRYSVPPPAPGATCLYQNFGGFELRWERHLEFANFTFITPDAEPFADNALAFIPKDWLAAIPGELMVAVNLVVTNSEPDEATIKRWFEGQRLAGSEIETNIEEDSNNAKVWTSFKLHSDGFGRIVAYNRSLSPSQTGRFIQRLYEIETYRLMSLLSLPVARKISPDLTRIENSLTTLNQQISEIDVEKDERELLQDLSHLAAEVERLRSDTNFRFAATVAYHDLVLDRLNQLHESPVEGFQTLREFLERRLTPGVKTCNSARDRLEDLSRRIHRTTSMLRTRVDLSIQEQNQDLLSSMNRRSQLQLRLQQTVEGLSVVVIGYYLLSLLEIALSGLNKVGIPIDVTLSKAAALPVVLALVFISMRIAKARVQMRTEKPNKNPTAKQ